MHNVGYNKWENMSFVDYNSVPITTISQGKVKKKRKSLWNVVSNLFLLPVAWKVAPITTIL